MSKRSVRTYTREFKEAAVKRIEGGERLREVAVALGVRRKLLYDWRSAYRAHGISGFKRRGRKPKPPDAPPDAKAELKAALKRIAELERKIGQQTVDLDFFRRALQVGEAERTPATRLAPTRSSKP